MQNRTISIGLFCYNVIFIAYLNCAQEQKQNLQQFFKDRVITYQELLDILPEDSQNRVQHFYDEDIARWQICDKNSVSTRCNDICLSEREDLIACANGLSVMIYNKDLQCVDSIPPVKEYLACKWYSLRNSNSEELPAPLLLCSSDDGNVLLRNIDTKTDLVKIKHGSITNAIDMNINTKRIVTGSDDNNACIWNCAQEDGTFAPNPILLRTLPHKGTVWKAIISNDGTMLATACLDGRARLFNIANGNVLCDVKHKEQVCFVHLTKNNKTLISAGDDGDICVTNIKDNRVERILHIPGKIYTLCVSDNDNFVAAGTDNGVVQVWVLSNYRSLLLVNPSQLFNRPAAINHLSFSENAHLLAIATGQTRGSFNAGECCILDIISEKWLYRKHYEQSVSYALLNKSGSMLITGVSNGEITITKVYNQDQIYLRKLFFLWLLIKRIDLNISTEEYLQDIKTSLNLDDSIDAIWKSFDMAEKKIVWKKCIQIMKNREDELQRISLQPATKKRRLEEKRYI